MILKYFILLIITIFNSLNASSIVSNISEVRKRSVNIDNVHEEWLLDPVTLEKLSEVQLAQSCRYAYNRKDLRDIFPKKIKDISSKEVLGKLRVMLSQMYNSDEDEWKYFCLIRAICLVRLAIIGDQFSRDWIIASNKKAESLLKNYDKSFDEDGAVFDLLVKLFRGKTEEEKRTKKKNPLRKRKHEEESEPTETPKQAKKRARKE